MRRYSPIVIFTHWATAILVVAAWLVAEGGPRLQENPPVLHFTFGFAVLMLVVPRLAARLFGSAPTVDDSRGSLWRLATKAGHVVLYAFLVGLPLSGWYAASRMGLPISFLGIPVPSIASPVEGHPGLIAELHENAGTLILILAGLHAVVAIWHQFVLKDGSLSRMAGLGVVAGGSSAAGR